MIDEIIRSLKIYNTAFLEICTKYSNQIPADFIKASEDTINTHIPYSSHEFFKLLNTAMRKNHYPESGLSLSEVVEILEKDKSQIEGIIEESKKEKEVVLFFPTKGEIPLHKALLIGLDNVRSSGTLILMHHKIGQTNSGEYKPNEFGF